MRAFRVLVLSGVPNIAMCRCVALGRELKLDKDYQVSTCRSNNLKNQNTNLFIYVFIYLFFG
jgi:hypothetical protein